MRHKSMIYAFGLIILASCGRASVTRAQASSVTISATPVSISTSPSASAPTPTSTPPAQTRPLAEIDADVRSAWAAILAETGNPVAKDVSQCGLMPVGARACGGPGGYIAYSRVVSDEVRLRALAEMHSRLSREWNAAAGVISICSIAVPPQVALVDGVCKTNDSRQPAAM